MPGIRRNMASTSNTLKDHFPVRKDTVRESTTAQPSTSASKQVAGIPPGFLASKQDDLQDDDDSPSENWFDKDMEALRQFDIDWKFGPCTGMTRLERWNRAEKFGLSPPEFIKELILANTAANIYTQCLWHKYNVLQ